MRRPAPELIERHFAGHVGGRGAQAAAASGVVEGVLLLLLLPEPFIVVLFGGSELALELFVQQN